MNFPLSLIFGLRNLTSFEIKDYLAEIASTSSQQKCG